MYEQEREQFLKEKHRKWNNPTIFIKSENAYSIVAKTEYTSKDKPFQRFKKYKDENGIYILFRKNKRAYETNWKYIS